jgi:hypothetical protein
VDEARRIAANIARLHRGAIRGDCWTNNHDGRMLLIWEPGRTTSATIARAAKGRQRRPRGGSEFSALLVASAQTIEKVLHRHVERQRKLIQRAGRYAIDGPFVFLQLRERNAERVGNHLLGQARFPPPQAQPRSNMALGRRSDIVPPTGPI